MPFNIDLDLSPIRSFENIDKGKFEDIDTGGRLAGSMYLPNLCVKSWLTFAMREGEGGRWGRPTVEPLIVPSLPKMCGSATYFYFQKLVDICNCNEREGGRGDGEDPLWSL